MNLPNEKIVNIEVTLEDGSVYSLELGELIIAEDEINANEIIMQLQNYNWKNNLKSNIGKDGYKSVKGNCCDCDLFETEYCENEDCDLVGIYRNRIYKLIKKD